MQRVFIYIISIFLPFILLSSCSLTHYVNLKKEKATKEEITDGSVILILHGNRYADDLETIAILDIEGDGYKFVPYTPEYNYIVKSGISVWDAIKEAEVFVSRGSSSFFQSRLSKIYDTEGRVIGYEVRPLYHPFKFGTSDVLDVNYSLRDDRVMVYIRLKHSVDNIDGRNRDDWNKGIERE